MKAFLIHVIKRPLKLLMVVYLKIPGGRRLLQWFIQHHPGLFSRLGILNLMKRHVFDVISQRRYLPYFLSCEEQDIYDRLFELEIQE